MTGVLLQRSPTLCPLRALRPGPLQHCEFDGDSAVAPHARRGRTGHCPRGAARGTGGAWAERCHVLLAEDVTLWQKRVVNGEVRGVTELGPKPTDSSKMLDRSPGV